ncbi:MAG: hypothetical protein Q8M29_10675 [Bacteroidota bacterium]|nr:hypothetical protein [Bacteroidota bacterium]
MKALKLLVAVMGISLLFASCKSNMDLTKRHYTKGYYFHKNSSIEQAATKEAVALKAKSPIVNDIPTNKVALTTNVSSSPELKGGVKENEITQGFSKAESTKGSATKGTSVTKVLKDKKASSVIQQKGKKTTPAGGSSDDVKLILCIILALFIPPLAMYLWDKNTDTWFIVDLVLFLLLFSWFFWGSLGLLGLASVVIAILRILGVI